MKLSYSIAFIPCLLADSAAHSSTEQSYHDLKQHIGNSMWTFGTSGVDVYSPDGKIHKRHTPEDTVCLAEVSSSSWGGSSCRFYDIVSDGKKYVWGANSKGGSKINVFNIDTGALVGNFATCENPRDLEYHPLRDEVWVRCPEVNINSTESTHLDVFSASSPSADVQTDILLKERALNEGLSSHGTTVIDDSLGDVGYLTDDSQNHLFKLDLSEKAIIDKFEMSPASYGLNEAAYSPVNKHIFIHSQVCCTCGFDGADLESCGRRPGYNVTPTTGPFAGQENIIGVCGSSCEGVPGIDNIGVYEFDTNQEKVVANHLLPEGIGADPFASPDGKYVVLLGKNGGKTIRILEAGEPGSKSSVFADLELDFNRSGYENLQVAKDFAFLQRDGKTKVVFAAGTEHKIAVVDLTDGSKNIRTNYITSTDAEFVRGRAPHGRYRQVEWAIGTDYVWVNDHQLNELYVIDAMKNELINTLKNVSSYRLLSVNNYEKVHQMEMQNDLISAFFQENAVTDQAAVKEVKSTSINEEETNDSPIALILGVAALLLGVVNLFVMCNFMNTTKEQIQKVGTPHQVKVRAGDDSVVSEQESMPSVA